MFAIEMSTYSILFIGIMLIAVVGFTLSNTRYKLQQKYNGKRKRSHSFNTDKQSFELLPMTIRVNPLLNFNNINYIPNSTELNFNDDEELMKSEPSLDFDEHSTIKLCLDQDPDANE